MKSILLFCLSLTIVLPLLAQVNCMQIGVGLSGPAYWEGGENPFIDQMKARGGWITFAASGGGAWDTQHASEFHYDSNGYPDSGVPYITSGGSEKLRLVVSASARIPQQTYVFLYDGNGVFTFNGFTVGSSTPGRIVVTCNTTGNAWIHIDSSAITPNHVRNFRLVPIANEFNHEQLLFRQPFLDKLDTFYALRFMDWFKTNGNDLNTWNQRILKSYYTQASARGTAYEYAIELSNRSGKHPWVCVPHLADSNYIAQMATLFRDSLDTTLSVYLEYSNEVWNYQFSQTQWINQTGQFYPSTWPPNPLYDAGQSFAYNAGKLAARTFRIWRNVWGADSLRVKRVLATQAANSFVATENIAAVNHQYDYLSPAWYFGISPNQANAYTSSTTPVQIIDSCRYAFFNNYLTDFKDHYTLANADQAKVIHYEGGQHISAYGNTSNPALQAMYDAQIHPNMHTLYDQVLDSMRVWGSELAMAFVLGGDNSQYGSWGHIRSVDSTSSTTYSPKFEALLNNLPSTIPGCTPSNSRNNDKSVSHWNIYPNPVQDKLFIQSEEDNTPIKINMFSATGIQVISERIIHSTTGIEVSSIPSGIYFIQGTTPTGEVIFSGKINVLH